MFLCRPIISRAIPKYPYWKATPKLQNVCNVVTASKRSLILSGGSWGRDINSQTVQTAHSSTLSASQAVLSSNAPKAEVKRADTGLPPLSVNTYFSLRQLDRSLVAAQPKCNYLHLLDLLNAPGAEELVDAIVLDILELFGGTEEERFELLQDALSKHQLKLSSRNLQVICQYIGEHPQFELSERAMHGLLRVLNREKIWTLQHINGFECIKPALLNMVSRNSVPGGVQSISYSPPTIIFAAFVLLRRLIRGQHRAAALELFQSLATAKLIPSEAMAGLDNISQSFNAILRVALIRACLRWQWHSLASIFLLDGLASSHSRSGPLPIFLDLNAEVFYELLNTPTHRDIRACERLIRHVHPFSPAPNSIIRLFYNRAHENDLIETAQSLYEFTRLSLSATSHPYPPPSGAALGWLMEHFAFRSKIPHLAKVLANEVAENNIPLIPPVRASFITCCAARSHSTIARKLWERYSLGKDKDQVLGNSRLMIRMVSLFTAVSKKASDSVEWGSQERELLTPQERLDIVNTSRSAHNFAIQVLKSFKNCHLPLSGASHTALTSYARGCFIVGRYAQGLAALGHLLRRKELPDLHDINVVLSAAAHSQPELGAQIVQRMEKRSIRPDAVTYTTIMQGAFLNGKRELITDMLHKLNSLSDARMSLKTLTNIIRITTHRFPEDSDEAMQTKLAQAHNLIIKHPEANIASSLQTGKYLIRRCIQADSPIFAFKFWQLWLQKGQQWDDIEHRYLRLLVARTIREHRDNLNPTLVSSALSQLIRRRGRTPPP